MVDEIIRLEKDDVTVEKIVTECDECTSAPETHMVMVDFRTAGQQHMLGKYCERCAQHIAARIRQGLPGASA